MPPTRGGTSAAVNAAALQAHTASLLRLDAAPGCLGPKQPPGPTLAQRLGLVPGPPPPLSPAQWLQVHLASQARGDSAGDCAICLRPFRADSQVLLSCSHTYHDRCLASLERFARQAGGAGTACCPLCRAVAFEKRRIDDAERLWRHACAARIQAAWRGLLARREFRALRRLVPPQHPALRRRWAVEALGYSAAPLVRCVDQDAAELDALFAELDASSAAAGAVFRELSARRPTVAGSESDAGGSAAAAAAAASGENGNVHPPEASAGSSHAGTSHGGAAGQGRAAAGSVSSRGGAQPVGREPMREQDWEAAIERCLQRDERPECAICLAPLGQLCVSSGSGGIGGGRTRTSTKGARPARGERTGEGTPRPAGIAVLSCSHAFHADCVSSFEAFAVMSELAPSCPCCRSPYARLDLC